MYATTGAYPQTQPTHQIGQAYWAGWILAYYQWVTGLSFRYITENGLPLSKIISLYRLHEADPSKFVETANAIMDATKRAIRYDHTYGEQGALELPTLDDIEHLLDETDKASASDNVRYTSEELFSKIRERMDEV